MFIHYNLGIGLDLRGGLVEGNLLSAVRNHEWQGIKPGCKEKLL
jgi:hypothetical protein